MKQNKCVASGMVYTSMPPQNRCINCERFWIIGQETPICLIQDEDTISLPRKPVVIGLWLVVIGLLIANVIIYGK